MAVKAQVRGKKGTIRLVRAGAVLNDYGLRATTAAEYGTAFAACLSDATAGDAILMDNVYAEGTNWTIADDNLSLLCRNSILSPNGNYEELLTINGDRVRAQGVTVDGQGSANASNYGRAIRVAGDHVQLRDVSAHRTRSSADITYGTGLFIDGDHCTVDGFFSEDVQYAAIIGSDADYLRLNNCFVHDAGDRSFNIRASAGDLNYLSITNFYALADEAVASADLSLVGSVGFNLNTDTDIRVCKMTNVYLVRTINWDVAASLHCGKIQNIRHLTMTNCHLSHLPNLNGTASNYSMRIEGPGSVAAPDTWIMDGCTFSGGISVGGHYPQFIRWNNCEFGHDFCEDNELLYNFRCADFRATNCVFNVHGALRVFTMSASHASTDKWAILNSRFEADKASDVYVVDSKIADSVGNNIFFGNTLNNSGAGNFNRTNTTASGHTINTDASGKFVVEATATSGDTTPSVKGIARLIANNVGSTSYTTFDDGIEGQPLEFIADSNTTLVHSASLKLAGATNSTPASGGYYRFIRRSSAWQEISRTLY